MDETPGLDAQIGVVGSLSSPLRRGLYRYVVGHGGGARREDAAQALGVSRSLAAYHLDRLVDEGLLTARFERRSDRRGPGQGRPAKVYDRAPHQFQISIPPRDYEIAAQLFASALDDPTPQPRVALARMAHALGVQLGTEAAKRAGTSASPPRRREALLEVMVERGYEPLNEAGTIRLRNCPFDALVAEHRDLVCHMNLEVIAGIIAALGADLEPMLDPRDGRCCVTIRTRS